MSLKISEDGRILSQNVLMSERKFFSGLRAEIEQDSKGGAYVMLRSGVTSAHQYVYHFNSEGIPDTLEADIRPAGYTGVIGSQTVIYPDTDQLVVLTIEKINGECSLSSAYSIFTSVRVKSSVDQAGIPSIFAEPYPYFAGRKI